jgi:hypothetical protein
MIFSDNWDAKRAPASPEKDEAFRRLRVKELFLTTPFYESGKEIRLAEPRKRVVFEDSRKFLFP